MKKKQSKKKAFADKIIGICLSMSAAITLFNMAEYHRLSEVMPASVITALLGLWGGELLILAVRQIFGSDVVGKAKGAPRAPAEEPGQDDEQSI